ncbi:hypothetical protein HG536_0C06140 [Torulaspora globosa]|uniref:Uncharacterized protein n=1 Tax=Torulaspora globosa TaxID=48254 RepID=A0A7G3ZG09_9SACH|nr:uncharacterized protein HG536_0C06140 [Torulaspora globosa]QLL32445.1 hypothetical protein HG536_0C06140 [Torulaspora globosa]
MALHNYIYLKHKGHDPSCHKLIARDHDARPSPTRSTQASAAGPADSIKTASDVIRAPTSANPK